MSATSAGSQRVPLIAGNWKMYKTSSEGAEFIRRLAQEVGDTAGREVVVAPAFTGLHAAVEAAESTAISVAAQDLFWEGEGAYTGEVSAKMLSDLGVAKTIIGHSERRRLFGENDMNVAKKVWAALQNSLAPLVCVGEDGEEREKGLTQEVLSRQVPAGLATLTPEHAGQLSIAYEPVWAIGTGKTATAQMAQEAIAFIREQVRVIFGDAAQTVRILYGGSVSPKNIDELMRQPDIDGVLVGGASLDIESFARIVKFETG